MAVIDYTLQDAFLARLFAGRLKNAFYLTGGTALARFYFHHRESADLDFFTQDQAIDFSEVNLEAEKISRDLGWKSINQVTTATYLQYIFEDVRKRTLKVDFVKDVPVHFGDFKKVGTITVDSLENIGSNKILAIFGRTDHKDFIDLYYILHETALTFDRLIQLAKQKDVGLTEFYLANAIQQIERVTLMPVLLKPLNRRDYIDFFKNLSKNLLLNIKPEQ